MRFSARQTGHDSLRPSKVNGFKQILLIVGLLIALTFGPATWPHYASNSWQEMIGDCPDSDGDSLCDAWENAGGIDLNGDGHINSARDLLVRDADLHVPHIY